MDRWEYQVRILYADIQHKGVEKYLQEQYPDWQPPRYSPEAMEKYLNEMGSKGWELIQMEPIYGSGRNADVLFIGGHVSDYSHAYFCVLKRRASE